MRKNPIAAAGSRVRHGKTRSGRQKVSQRVACALLTGLLCAYSPNLWTPKAFADGANVTITSEHDYENSPYYHQPDSSAFSLPGSYNILTINASPLNGQEDIMGGFSQTGRVTGNTVYFVNGDTILDVAGGWSEEDGSVDHNTVTISGGTVGDNVVGGFSTNGSATSNTVIMSGGTAEYVVGGNGLDSVTDNTVTISGGTVGGGVCGAYARGGSATNNTVSISGGAVRWINGGWGWEVGNHNTVIVSGGTIGAISGGVGICEDANNNTVTISGGAVEGVTGGASEGADVVGVDSDRGLGSAASNTVTISGGTVTGAVFGGVAGTNDRVYYCRATNNTVTILGGMVSGSVYGGYVFTGMNNTNNTVTIDNTRGTLILTGATLYGSNIAQDYNTASNAMLGNTLNVYGKGITAVNVANFSNINFYLPSDIVNGDTVLKLTDSAATDLSRSTIKAGITGSANIHTGDKITLLTNDAGLTTTGTTYGQLTQGVSSQYDLTVLQSGNSIIATILSATPSGSNLLPQTQSLVETRTASAAFLNRGMDMFSGQGMANAVAAAQGTVEAGVNKTNKFTPFGVIGGHSMRYATGSYVNGHGSNLGVGFSRTLTNRQGKLTFGPLIEAGWGQYDSYLDSGVHGWGHTNYYGAGLLARQDQPNGLYYEGSLHGGYMDSDYNSTDLIGIGQETYSLRTPYYAGHVGIGKISHLNDNHSLEVYGKYYYSHQGGKSAELASGETYDFAGVTSNRLRIGARYSNQYAPTKKTYIETAYEYEMDGDATAGYRGYSTLTPTLKGGSGMLGFGYQITPGKTSPLAIDMSVNGWVGRQRGVSSNVKLDWKF